MTTLSIELDALEDHEGRDAHPPMRGRILRIADITEQDEKRWSALAQSAAEPNPLFEPECLVPAAKHLVNGDQMKLVVAEAEDQFYGCFPIRREDRWRSIHRPLLTTQVRRMQYDGTPLLDLARKDEAAVALLSTVATESRKGNPGLILFDWLDEDGPVAAAIQQACATLGYPTYRYNTWERPLLRRRESSTYRSDHGSMSTRKLGQHRRNLTKAAGGEVRITDRSHDPSIIESLVKLEAAGYKGTTGSALATHRGEVEWFQEMCERFRAANRLYVYALRAGDRDVAILLLIRGAGGMFALKLAYDEEFGRHRPGIHLLMDAIDYIHDQTNIDWIDTCTYEGNETLLRVFPDRRNVVSLLTSVGGPVDRGHLRALRVARGLKHRLTRSG